MANVKLSQLPVYPGTATDLRWFVMNNSGETTTYKFSGYSSQIIPGNGEASYVSISLSRSYAPDPYMIVLGNHSGTTTSSGQNSAVLGGRNNKTNNQFGVVAGGLNNTAGYICGVFGGNGGNANGNTAIIIGGENNTCSNVAWGGVFNGIQNYLAGGNDVGNGIYGGYLNRLSVNGVYGSSIIGGRENRWHHFDSRSVNTRYSYGAILGGYQNRIEGLTTDSSGSHSFPIILGGIGNRLFGSEAADSATTGSTIMNSSGCTITDSLHSAIIEGLASSISAKTQAVMVGTNNRAALYDNTTHVENSHNFKTESFNVTNSGSVGGNIDVDCSLGTLFYFTITADTTPNFINWKEGQRLQFWVDNSGTFTVPTATISGGGSVYSKGGTINPTNNEITAYYGTIVNGNMFLDEHLNFQPV